MKAYTISIHDITPKELSEDIRLGIRIVLSNGHSFDITENLNDPGFLRISNASGGGLTVQPRAANVIVIQEGQL